MLCSAQANDNPLEGSLVQLGKEFLPVIVTRDCKLIFGSANEGTLRQILYQRNGQEDWIVSDNAFKKVDEIYLTGAIQCYKGDGLILPTANLFIKEDKLLAQGLPVTHNGRDAYFFEESDHVQKVEMFPPVLIYENGKLIHAGSSGSNSRGFYDEAKNSKLRGMFGRR